MQSVDRSATSIPPELTGPTPRRVRLEAVLLVLPVLMFICLSGVPTYLVMNEVNHRNALRKNSSKTFGQIEAAWLAGRGAGVATVRYTFSVNGSNYTGKEQVPRQLFKGLQKGGLLTVRYVPSDPSINHPADWEWSPGFGEYVLPYFGFPIVIFFGFGFRSQRRFAVEGLPAIAIVTGTSRVSRGGLFVNYEFHTEDGRLFQGSHSSDDRMEAGTRICILYLPENPKRNTTYPLGPYRILSAGGTLGPLAD